MRINNYMIIEGTTEIPVKDIEDHEFDNYTGTIFLSVPGGLAVIENKNFDIAFRNYQAITDAIQHYNVHNMCLN